MKKIIHGGQLEIIEEIYKIKKEEIIDFSGNINPIPIPENISKKIVENIHIIQKYPDKDYKILKDSISTYCQTNINNIIVGNGATEIISTVFKIASPKNAIIVSPSYSEYEKTLKKINCNIRFFELKENENFILNVENLVNFYKDEDIIIICNPNNPTGTAINIDEINYIAEKLKKALIVIDETYAEFTNFKDNISAIKCSENFDNIFIIRGTSKFFSLPGIRLGYGICSNKKLIKKINEEKDPWSVNVFANLIGIEIFKNKDFINKTQNLIFIEREKFFKELKLINSIKFYESKSNFILCKILNEKTSDYIFENLIKNKILIRNAKEFNFLNDKFFRFCILTPKNNELLLNNLKKYL